MYTMTNAVAISNTINSGTGDTLRVAFGKINIAIQSLGDYINLHTMPTAIAYLSTNTVPSVGDQATTLTGDFVPSSNLTATLGRADSAWSNLYVGIVSTTDLTVSGTLVALADGGSF
jgi:hypothetical protein